MTEPNAGERPQDIPTLDAGKGSMAGMLAALTVLALVAIAAFWLIGTRGTSAAAPSMTIAVEASGPTPVRVAPKGTERVQR